MSKAPYMNLHFACKEGNLYLARKFLEERNSPIDEIDKFDCTPLYYACLCGHAHIVTYLLNKGATFNLNTLNGERTYLSSLTVGIRHILKEHHVRRHPQPNPKSIRNKQPIEKKPKKPPITDPWDEVYHNDFVEAKRLFKINTFVNNPDRIGFNLLDYAIFFNNSEAIEMLLDDGAFHTLHSQMNDLLNTTNTSSFRDSADIVLKVGDKEIRVHSSVMAARCPSFLESFLPNHYPIASISSNYSPSWIPFTTFYGKKHTEVITIDPSILPYDALMTYIKFIYTENPIYDINTLEILHTATKIFKFNPMVIPSTSSYVSHNPKTWEIRRTMIASHFAELINNPICSDLILNVNGTSIFCHKAILGSRSPYFKNMLYGYLNESKLSIINIEHLDQLVNPELSMLHLIEYLYTGHVFHFDSYIFTGSAEESDVSVRTPNSLFEKCGDVLFRNIALYNVDPSITSLVTSALFTTKAFRQRNSNLSINMTEDEKNTLAFDLIQLSDMYFLPSLKAKCEDYLCHFFTLTVSIACDVWHLANRIKAVILKRKIEDFIAQKFGFVINFDKQGWESIPNCDRDRIKNLSMNYPKLRQEEEVYLEAVLMKQAREEERKEQQKKKVVRKEVTPVPEEKEETEEKDIGEEVVFQVPVTSSKLKQKKSKTKKRQTKHLSKVTLLHKISFGTVSYFAPKSRDASLVILNSQ